MTVSEGFWLAVGLIAGFFGTFSLFMFASGLPWPHSRHSLARLFVLLAMRLLPKDGWAWGRLWWVNDSLKRSVDDLKSDAETGGRP